MGPAEKLLRAKCMAGSDISTGSCKIQRKKKKCGFIERFNPIPGVDEMSFYDIFLNS